MRLSTFRKEKKTAFFFDEKKLQTMPCGLFRCPAEEVQDRMPYFANLIASAPVDDLRDYEVDIKIHMLMPDQYPCIPNWHCDNVPRNSEGKVDYQEVSEEKRMYLWISDGPETEFLSEEPEPSIPIRNHRALANYIQQLRPKTEFLEPNYWVSMNQLTPHRGTSATKPGWRVFVRLTPKTIAPARPVYDHIRRHAQVYLNPNTFTW